MPFGLPTCYYAVVRQPRAVSTKVAYVPRHPCSALAASPGERRRSGHLLAAGERVSAAGDLRAMAWLRAACQRHVAGMPTSLSQDEALLEGLMLQQQEGDQGGRNAVQGTPAAPDQQATDGVNRPMPTDMPEAAARLPASSGSSSSSPSYPLAVQWRTCQKR